VSWNGHTSRIIVNVSAPTGSLSGWDRVQVAEFWAADARKEDIASPSDAGRPRWIFFQKESPPKFQWLPTRLLPGKTHGYSVFRNLFITQSASISPSRNPSEGEDCIVAGAKLLEKDCARNVSTDEIGLSYARRPNLYCSKGDEGFRLSSIGKGISQGIAEVSSWTGRIKEWLLFWHHCDFTSVFSHLCWFPLAVFLRHVPNMLMTPSHDMESWRDFFLRPDVFLDAIHFVKADSIRCAEFNIWIRN